MVANILFLWYTLLQWEVRDLINFFPCRNVRPLSRIRAQRTYGYSFRQKPAGFLTSCRRYQLDLVALHLTKSGYRKCKLKVSLQKLRAPLGCRHSKERLWCLADPISTSSGSEWCNWCVKNSFTLEWESVFSSHHSFILQKQQASGIPSFMKMYLVVCLHEIMDPWCHSLI